MLNAADVIAERGFTINDAFLHGFGIGLLAPLIRSRESAARRGPPGPKFTFEENMCVVVQPNVVTHDEHAGLQLGNLFASRGTAPNAFTGCRSSTTSSTSARFVLRLRAAGCTIQQRAG